MVALKELIYFQILFVVGIYGYPASDPKTTEDVNCIHMTKDNTEKINDLVDEISSFINKISTKYDDIDLRLVEIAVDKHSLVENKKNTTVHVTVSDCLEGIIRTEYSRDGTRNKNNYNDNDDAETDEDNSESKESDEESKNNDTNESNDEDKLSDDDNTELKDDSDSDTQSNEDSDEVKDSKEINVTNDEDELDDNDKYDNEADETQETTHDDDDDDNSEIANDDTLTKYDCKLNKKQEFNNTESNNIETVRFIMFNDTKVSNNELNDKNETRQEILQLTEDDKVVFNEIEKIRGPKPFFLYQKFFINTTQNWFL